MNRLLRHFAVFSFVAVPCLVEAQVTAPDAELRLVADGYSFTEGPTTERVGKRVLHRSTQRPYRPFRLRDRARRQPGCSHRVGATGCTSSHPIASSPARTRTMNLWSHRRQHQKQHQVLAAGIEGRRFGGPNDCWVDRDGSDLLHGPFYKRPYWTQQFSDDHSAGRCIVCRPPGRIDASAR